MLAAATPMARRRRGRWGLTVDERERRSWPGDALVAAPRWSWTHGISIAASPERVWPWVAQIGQGKGGFYSYQALENLAGCEIRNADRLVPAWTEVAVGDVLNLHPRMPMDVVEVEPGRWFVAHVRVVPKPGRFMDLSWLFHVSEADGSSRVVSRFRCASSDDLPTRLSIGPTFLEPLGFAMDRRMLLGIRDRVEGRSRLRGGLTALGLVALGYAACILLLAVGGAKPGPAPWLVLSPDTYFWWESLFIAPVIVGAGILAAGVVQLGARALGGRGSFEDTLGLLGWAVAASTLATLLPDLAVGITLCLGLMQPETWMESISRPTPVLALVWVYLLTYVGLFLITFPAVVRAAHGLGRGRAIAVGWAAFAVYQLVVYVFVR